MTAGYDTLIVTFSDPICVLDRMFDCPAWGVESLKEWIDGYESTRMTPINDHTAVITGEYNFEQVKVWLEKYVPIKSLKIS